MSDELLQAMWDAFTAAYDGDSKLESGRAVLDVLHANGYRRCAEGQAVTQWCAEAERVRANLKALEDEHIAYADDVGDALGQRKGEPLLTCARRVVAEVERLRADAERYRWLRREVDGPHAPLAQVLWKFNNIRDNFRWTNLSDGQTLDEHIDAARGES